MNTMNRPLEDAKQTAADYIEQEYKRRINLLADQVILAEFAKQLIDEKENRREGELTKTGTRTTFETEDGRTFEADIGIKEVEAE